MTGNKTITHTHIPSAFENPQLWSLRVEHFWSRAVCQFQTVVHSEPPVTTKNKKSRTMGHCPTHGSGVEVAFLPPQQLAPASEKRIWVEMREVFQSCPQTFLEFTLTMSNKATCVGKTLCWLYLTCCNMTELWGNSSLNGQSQSRSTRAALG